MEGLPYQIVFFPMAEGGWGAQYPPRPKVRRGVTCLSLLWLVGSSLHSVDETVEISGVPEVIEETVYRRRLGVLTAYPVVVRFSEGFTRVTAEFADVRLDHSGAGVREALVALGDWWSVEVRDVLDQPEFSTGEALECGFNYVLAEPPLWTGVAQLTFARPFRDTATVLRFGAPRPLRPDETLKSTEGDDWVGTLWAGGFVAPVGADDECVEVDEDPVGVLLKVLQCVCEILDCRGIECTGVTLEDLHVSTFWRTWETAGPANVGWRKTKGETFEFYAEFPSPACSNRWVTADLAEGLCRLGRLLHRADALGVEERSDAMFRFWGRVEDELTGATQRQGIRVQARNGPIVGERNGWPCVLGLPKGAAPHRSEAVVGDRIVGIGEFEVRTLAEFQVLMRCAPLRVSWDVVRDGVRLVVWPEGKPKD